MKGLFDKNFKLLSLLANLSSKRFIEFAEISFEVMMLEKHLTDLYIAFSFYNSISCTRRSSETMVGTS